MTHRWGDWGLGIGGNDARETKREMQTKASKRRQNKNVSKSIP
jgi:hypothetical protein